MLTFSKALAIAAIWISTPLFALIALPTIVGPIFVAYYAFHATFAIADPEGYRLYQQRRHEIELAEARKDQ